MRYIVWGIKFLVFAVVVMFAYKNMGPVEVVLFDGLRWPEVPLIVVILVSFILGTLLGAVLMLPGTWRRGRETWRLRRDLGKAQSTAAKPSSSASTASSESTSTVTPL